MNEDALRRIQRTFDAVAAGSVPSAIDPRDSARSAASAPAPPSAPGGFLIDDDGDDAAESSTTGGGFIVDDDGSTEERRLPLSRVARALRQLSIPRSADVSRVFEDAASSDEEAGERTVSKERFVEICSVLLPQSSDEEDDSDDDAAQDDDDQGDEYKDEDEGRSARTTTTKRVTRTRTRKDPSLLTHDKLSDTDSELDDDDHPFSGGDAGTKSKGSAKTKKNKRRRKDDLDLDRQGQRQVFDLFFTAGLGAGSATGPLAAPRTIGMGELRNVAAVLKEKLTDDDLLEMLEYANEGRPVDLEAFHRLCQEL